jgi:hypothetical protein
LSPYKGSKYTRSSKRAASRFHAVTVPADRPASSAKP